METYSFLLYWRDDFSGPMERHQLDLPEPPKIDEVVEIAPGWRWRVMRQHIPADRTEPEPNAFDCLPAD